MANVVETEFRLKGWQQAKDQIEAYQKALQNVGKQSGKGASVDAIAKAEERAAKRVSDAWAKSFERQEKEARKIAEAIAKDRERKEKETQSFAQNAAKTRAQLAAKGG